MKNDNVANILRDLINDVTSSSGSSSNSPAPSPMNLASAASPVPSTVTIKAENEQQAERELNKLVSDLDARYRLQSQQGKFNGAHNLADSKLPHIISHAGKTYELTGVKKHILKTVEQEVIGKCNCKNWNLKITKQMNLATKMKTDQWFVCFFYRKRSINVSMIY